MAFYKLTDDFYEINYTLFAIHSPLETYRLAYFLNGCLQTNFKKITTHINFEKNTTISLYQWENEYEETVWSLLANRYTTSLKTNTTFFEEDETVNYLIPEQKRVDFFLKIEHEEFFEQEKKIIQNISKIPKISTAYTIELNQLKSKNNLIF